MMISKSQEYSETLAKSKLKTIFAGTSSEWAVIGDNRGKLDVQITSFQNIRVKSR